MNWLSAQVIKKPTITHLLEDSTYQQRTQSSVLEYRPILFFARRKLLIVLYAFSIVSESLSLIQYNFMLG